MSQIYIEYHFTMVPLQPTSEILVAQLGELGFESFTETETGLKAYIQKKELNPSLIDDIQALNWLEFEISYKVVEIPQVNWNAEWEKNFNPIEVNGECALRAPFHPPFNVKYEIIIEPKMSFGTGHHETTFMMLQFILENEQKNHWLISHYLPQYKFTHNYRDKPLMDFIGKLENIEEDWKYITEILKLEKELLRSEKYSSGFSYDYESYYTPKLKEIVYELYEKDFIYFDYEK